MLNRVANAATSTERANFLYRRAQNAILARKTTAAP
jgi:hypothetical protein